MAKVYKDEKAVKADITKELKKVGAYIVMYVPVGFGKAGVPDYVASVGGRFIGIEAKKNAKKNPPTKLQVMNLLQIRESGGVAVVVDETNIDKLSSILAMTTEGMPAKEIELLSACEIKSPLGMEE